jgi:hypothetical protein
MKRIFGLTAILAVTLASAGTSAKELSRTQLEVLRSEIQACWNIPILKDNDYELVVVEVNLNRDGSLAENPVVTNSSQNKNFKVLAASAVRSVVRCAPFKSVASLSESYEDWRKITISFDPRELTR